MAISCRTEVAAPTGKFRVDALMHTVPRGPGSVCPPDTARRGRATTTGPPSTSPPGTTPGVHQLLIRRNRTTGEPAHDRCYSPRPVPLGAFVRVAGTRWQIEETFQAGTGLAGLDQHQVRHFTPWLRWTTLAVLAHAFLAVVRAAEDRHRPATINLIALTCNAIRHSFTTASTGDPREHRLHWSLWRRRHHARDCHYRRREAIA